MQSRKLTQCRWIAAAVLASCALMTGCGSSESATQESTTTFMEDIPADDPYYQQYLESHNSTQAAAGDTTAQTTDSTQAISTPESISSDASTGDTEASEAAESASSESTESAEADTQAASEETAEAASSGTSDDPNVGTVTGTVASQSNSSQIFLSTDEDELEFEFNSSTDVSECSGITVGKKLTITYSTDENGMLVATKIADAQ